MAHWTNDWNEVLTFETNHPGVDVKQWKLGGWVIPLNPDPLKFPIGKPAAYDASQDVPARGQGIDIIKYIPYIAGGIVAVIVIKKLMK